MKKKHHLAPKIERKDGHISCKQIILVSRECHDSGGIKFSDLAGIQFEVVGQAIVTAESHLQEQ